MKTRHIIIFVILATAIAGMRYFTLPTVTSSPVIPTPITVPSTTVKVSPSTAPTSVDVSEYPLLAVPFTPQAPFGNWEDLRQEDGCEEASSLMAVYWVRGKVLTPTIAEREILAISNYEQQTYGSFEDTSAEDTNTRILRNYFKYNDAQVSHGITADDIKKELLKGNALIIPMNGQKLGNPYYTQPGPVKHMLVVKGYDPKRKEFITNDPGTKRGESYRYDENVFFNAIQDYETGHKVQIIPGKKSMIVIVPTGN